MSTLSKFTPCLVLGVTLAACEGPPCDECDDYVIDDNDDDFEAIQTMFSEAEDGDVLFIAAGTYELDRELILSRNDVTVLGAGRSWTILDFAEQEQADISGANGLKITGDGVTVESFQVRNAPGDGIRFENANGVTYRNIYVTWEDDDPTLHGAYGIYPVGCNDVLVEDSLVVGSRDAGVYVGQSNDIIVRGNEAHGNVAGIEIENSHRALVTENWAHDNTGGILVFNLPGLEQFDGACTEVVDNLIENNNVPNFAPGGTVQQIPRGTGILLLASSLADVHDNQIIGNGGPATMVVNYDTNLFGAYEDANFDPWPRGNWIHDNTFSDNGTDPQGFILDLVQGVDPIPELVWDGCYEDPDVVPDAERYCATGNVRDDGTEVAFVNFKFCDGFQNKVFDVSTVECEIPESQSCGVPTGSED